MGETIKPTPSQQNAIDARGSSILVSAGAGSGKTRVLIQRLTRYMTDPVAPADIDSFLIITFTRAAAAELRGRIAAAISELLQEDPDNRFLRRQSALCRRAKIGTIHSFCADLLRENAAEAKIAPDFKIVDDDRAAAMKAAALERLLEEHYAAGETDRGFLNLADTVGEGRDDHRLAELVLKLHAQLQAHARPEQWVDNQILRLESENHAFTGSAWEREILSDVRKRARFWLSEMLQRQEEIAEEPNLQRPYGENLQIIVDELQKLAEVVEENGTDRGEDNWTPNDHCWEAVFAGRPLGWPSVSGKGARKKPLDEERNELFKVQRDACKDEFKRLNALVNAKAEQKNAEVQSCAPIMTALLRLTMEFDALYAADKKKAGLLDYADLEHSAARLLTDENGRPTEIAAQISQRYTEIMVDEYQDVSAVQETVFSAIARRNSDPASSQAAHSNLFMVGDLKQSIYRFRLAAPELFEQKMRTYADYTPNSKGAPRQIRLQENFRSRAEILNAANAVFGTCMSPELGDTEYDENTRLKLGAVYMGSVPKPEVCVLKKRKGEVDDEAESMDAQEQEADYVARRIRLLMQQGITVGAGEKTRPLTYSDIAILMRSANKVAGTYRRVLARYGIPSTSNGVGGFFESAEVAALLAMLDVIDNPNKDIPLLTVLRYLRFGFTADELAEVRASGKKKNFYAALQSAAAAGHKKSSEFLALYARLRTLAPDMQVSELVWTVINELDMMAICSAMPNAAEKRDNLLNFAALAERYESTGYHGLHRFLRWIEKMRENGREPAPAAGGSSSVQIMSVHKSKGLEFPVVFLCDTGRIFNLRDTNEAVILDRELGVGSNVIDLDLRQRYPSPAKQAIKIKTDRETLSEEMRLLYVAMTRARERLIITGMMGGKADETITKIGSLASVSSPRNALPFYGYKTMLGWLVYACKADKERNLHLVMADELAVENGNVPDEPAAETKAEDAAVLQAELKERLEFVYRQEDAVELPSKLTATGISEAASEEEKEAAELLHAPKEFLFRIPDLSAGGEETRRLTAAERGTATHKVLQYMDYEKADTAAQITEEISRLQHQKFISPGEAEAVSAETIRRLFASPLGKRMRAAEQIRREFRFSVLCRASELLPTNSQEEVLLQGVADCCLVEPDGIVIVDYKTDRVWTDADLEERAAYYAPQINAYRAALEKIFELPVKECVLYFLSVGREYRVKVQAEKQ
ncbi:MAG: helicase-exonuclease AddAB subunit AddA [Oscillospiraceae bacterium]|nr:helicase-exonuclease AddAB subunit AddA [Oscillospiraceae bacterium]